MPQKKYREREKSVRIVPFSQQLHIILTNDMQAAFDRREEVFGHHELSPLAGACTWTTDQSTHIYVFFSEEPDISTIAHELIHVIAHVMRQNGVQFEEEVWAYHMSELIDITLEFVLSTRQRKRKTSAKSRK